MRGGKRDGAGRPKGAKNKSTIAQIEAIRETGQTPLEYLTSVYQDELEERKTRIEAAKAAAPYCHARLNAVELSGDADNPVEIREIRRTIVRPD